MATQKTEQYKIDPAHMQDIFIYAKEDFLRSYNYFTEEEYNDMVTKFFQSNYTKEEIENNIPLEDCCAAVQKAYNYHKEIDKNELLKLVSTGYKRNLVKIIYAEATKDCGCDGIACRIGDNCFYFGGHTTEEYDNVYDYIRDTDKEDNIRNITETILALHKDGFEDEAEYYYQYLKYKINL